MRLARLHCGGVWAVRGAYNIMAKERIVLGKYYMHCRSRRRITKSREKASLVGEATFLPGKLIGGRLGGGKQ